jgi:glycosyltransferase involved in cell wall biosynthesis
MTLHAVPFPSFFDRGTAAPQRLRVLGRLYLRFLHRIEHHVTTFVVHEREQVETLIEIAGISSDRIRVIPHGVDDPSSDDGLPADAPPTIGVYGYLTPYKDLHYLLDEFEHFRRTHEDARLVFSVAPHPERKDRSSSALYKELMERAKRIPSVETMGYIADGDLSAFLKNCHAIVTPYRYVVSSSGVMAHTLSAGTPTLVPDFIAHPQSQEWTFKYEPGGLARALARLVPQFAKQADALRTIAADRSWHDVALQHREMYERLR